MANERTFLAWIRTSIGIMAFGFVVEKFALFIKKMGYFFERSNIHETAPTSVGYSSIFLDNGKREGPDLSGPCRQYQMLLVLILVEAAGVEPA